MYQAITELRALCPAFHYASLQTQQFSLLIVRSQSGCQMLESSSYTARYIWWLRLSGFDLTNKLVKLRCITGHFCFNVTKPSADLSIIKASCVIQKKIKNL